MATTGWPAASKSRRQYGAEFELADWHQRRPHRWRTDLDWTMVNSNGIAVDPRGRVYQFGGEVLAEPVSDPSGVAEQLYEFVRKFPETSVNYRSNLHVHVHVPGLRDNLALLKKLQRFTVAWMPKVFPLIEPIPSPRRTDYPDLDAWKGARKRFARRKISHQKVLTPRAFARQMRARSCDDFFEAEALHEESGRVLWATCPRCAVNLRQLIATDTIEFRHFPGTIDPDEVQTAVEWCDMFLSCAFDDASPVDMYHDAFADLRFPRFHPYVHWMELTYHKTNPHYVGAGPAAKAIREVLSNEHPVYMPR